MPKYQIVLAVDIEADTPEDAQDIAAELEQFLGMHHLTTTLGNATDILELEEDNSEDDEEFAFDQDEDYDPMDDVNYVGHPIHY